MYDKKPGNASREGIYSTGGKAWFGMDKRNPRTEAGFEDNTSRNQFEGYGR